LIASGVACGSDAAGPNQASNDGGSNSSSTTVGGQVTNLPCDVDSILRSRCQTCHAASPVGGATVSLVTHDDLTQDRNGKKVYELVGQRIHDTNSPMPPKPASLTADELATLDRYVAASAPGATDKCDLGAAPDAVKPLNCIPDVVLKSKTPFTMPAGLPDIYMCFGASITVDKKRHVTAFGPHVDNKKVVHHILLFKSATAVPADPFPCSGVGSAVWQLVSGWAPGNGNLELPPEAGFPEEVGDTHWVLQVHYNNLSGEYDGQVDASGYELCTTDNLRANDAGIAGFGTIGISIPPRSKTTLTCTFPATAAFKDKHFFNAFPHMHRLGTAISTERVPMNGDTPETIAADDNYDFNNQQNVSSAVTVGAGDNLRTHCTWKNPSDQTVTFGEATENEMCFNFLSFYPANGIPWEAPSLSPACTRDVANLQ
jgi:hypothetical protein